MTTDPKLKPTPPSNHRVTVRVAGTQEFAGAACWQVDYTFVSPSPPGIDGTYRVLVRRQDGWPCRIVHNDEVLGDLFDSIGGRPVITGAPAGLPVELFPLPEAGEIKTAESALSLRLLKRGFEQVEVQEAFVQRGPLADVMLKQVWKKGEKSWREYERHYKGSKDLVAKVINPTALLVGPVPEFPNVPKATDEELKRAFGRDPDGLANDPRLLAKVTAKLDKPTAPEIIQKLQEATGVRLEHNEQVTADRVAYAVVGWNNRPAWMVMVELAESPAVAGHWEKDGDGYRLIGTLPLEDKGSSRLSAWLWVMAVPLALGLGAGAWRVARRWRQGRTVAPAPGLTLDSAPSLRQERT